MQRHSSSIDYIKLCRQSKLDEAISIYFRRKDIEKKLFAATFFFDTMEPFQSFVQTLFC